MKGKVVIFQDAINLRAYLAEQISKKEYIKSLSDKIEKKFEYKENDV